MSDKIRVFALGGLDEYGKNLQVVEINDNIFVLGCGTKSPDKTTPGIDYIIPDPDYLIKNKDRVRAYFLPHGHNDECSALTYFYKSCPAPIYCTNVTKQNFLKFTKHIRMPEQRFNFVTIEPTSEVKISGYNFRFFQTCHNISDSCGVAIETDLGNIIYMSDFIIDNNAEEHYLCDLASIAKLGRQKTLLLMCESVYAAKLGYTSPKHKLTPLVMKEFELSKGKIFVSLFSFNAYNIDEVFKLAKAYRRKVVCYDDETKDVVETFLLSDVGSSYHSSLLLSADDINRVNETEVIVLLCGHSAKIYNKMKMLANGLSSERTISLNKQDTFIMASPSNLNTEIEATDAIDELYRSGAHIVYFTSKTLASMHASEEDLKMIISLTKPRYYMPIKGSFRQMLANGELALNMGIGLNYSNVFLLDNGNVLYIDDRGAHVEAESIKNGDVYVDGFGVADSNSSSMDERTKLGQDGVVIMAITISKKEKKIVSLPDIQMRGFIFLKDADSIIKELTNILISTCEEYLEKPYATWDEAKQIIYENSLRTIRKETGKTPVILPLIMELDN